MEPTLNPLQEIRAIALREANYYFGFVARVERTPEMGPKDPTVRAGLVMEMADHFANYIETGDRPQ